MAAAPPLRVILSGLALAVGFIVLLALYRMLPGDRHDNTIAGQTQRFLDAPADAGKLRVIALGSSLLWAATPQPASVQRAARSHTGHRLVAHDQGRSRLGSIAGWPGSN